jgi:hypothetical protein
MYILFEGTNVFGYELYYGVDTGGETKSSRRHPFNASPATPPPKHTTNTTQDGLQGWWRRTSPFNLVGLRRGEKEDVKLNIGMCLCFVGHWCVFNHF